MSEVALTEQLDRAIEARFRTPEARLADTDPQVAELLGIATELRTLPRAEFRLRLRQELEQETSISTDTEAGEREELPRPRVNPIREGFRTVTPYLTVADVHAEIEFVTTAFGATGTLYGLGSAGGFHSEYKIGDSM